MARACGCMWGRVEAGGGWWGRVRLGEGVRRWRQQRRGAPRKRRASCRVRGSVCKTSWGKCGTPTAWLPPTAGRACGAALARRCARGRLRSGRSGDGDTPIRPRAARGGKGTWSGSSCRTRRRGSCRASTGAEIPGTWTSILIQWRCRRRGRWLAGAAEAARARWRRRRSARRLPRGAGRASRGAPAGLFGQVARRSSGVIWSGSCNSC